MKKLYHLITLLLLCPFVNAQSTAIRSSLLNLGSNSCGDNSNVSFSAVGNPNISPYLISNCPLSSIFGDVYNKFIAYNPKDNKIYINDISQGDSRVYVYDMGLPNNYSCPVSMPQTPTYEYSYVPNNWEFDKDGNVWCIKGLNGTTATIERIDETNGNIISSKTLDFPAGNVPNTLSSGDIVIIPNGRLFIAFGSGPTKFFEVTNYTSTQGDATATYIQDMPKPCYGILYINGTIELTGTDFGSSCYKYLYDIPTGVMGSEQSFQLSMSPVDNGSLSPATGVSKEVKGSTFVNSNTAVISYEINARNMGNVKLNNFNVTDDLASAFGAANILNVDLQVDAANNPGNLTLNPSYNGISNIELLNEGQIMNNFNGYIKMFLKVTVTNLIPNHTYYNTTKSLGDIGVAGLKVAVIDSSNNGNENAIDPNSDGDAGDVNENIPTPYFFGSVLPVTFVNIKAENIKNNANKISWSIGGVKSSVDSFAVEYSNDNKNWRIAGSVSTQGNSLSYAFNHTVNPDTYYYRIKAYDNKGQSFYSNTAVVKMAITSDKLTVLPNPADDAITISSATTDYTKNRKVFITNSAGKKVFEDDYISQNKYIHTSSYPGGYYIVTVTDKGSSINYQVIIRHE